MIPVLYGGLQNAGRALVAFLPVLVLFSVSPATAQFDPNRPPPKVVVSIKPLHGLVSALMEGRGEPILLIEGASSPHTASLKPSQARDLQEADLIFWIGPELERFLEKPLASVASDALVEAMIDARDLYLYSPREGGSFGAHEDHDHDDDNEDAHDEHGEHDDHEAGAEEIDPHIWLDPINAVAMINEMVEALSAVDPNGQAIYHHNFMELWQKLMDLHAEVATTIKPVKGKNFIVFHDSYLYFEQRYNMPAAGSLIISPDVQPGVARIREIRHKIEDLNAVRVFTEPQFQPKLVRAVTEGAGAKTGVLDPLGADLPAGPGFYQDLLRGLAKSLANCLK